MSRLLSLHLIAKNIPLHTWEQYEKDNDLEKTSQQSTGYSNKNNTRVISDIVRQLSSDKTVALIARDWDNYPPDIRIGISTMVNASHRSGNVTKNVQRLDRLLNGRLLSTKKDDGVVVRERVESRDSVYRKDKHISGSKAGAMRKYQILN